MPRIGESTETPGGRGRGEHEVPTLGYTVSFLVMEMSQN